MPAASVVILVLAALSVFAIAAVAVGREARRLDAVAPRAVYDVDEAVAYVADALPEPSQARLTYDELRQLLQAHMAQLRRKGLQPPTAVDQRQDIVSSVVVDDTGDAGYLIGQAESRGLDVTDEDVVHVVDAHLAYLRDIGAVGPPADDDASGDR
ncbi:MAG TPA: hypothetical protein VG478_04720 [Acidimicrobiales bacterium]|nr:hypothetical protein [Acidimicrobiales bacterium]